VHGRVVHVVFRERAGEVVLHEDVAGGDELVQEGDARGVLEGEAERFLVTVYLGFVRKAEKGLGRGMEILTER